jgi:hypothetical protein
MKSKKDKTGFSLIELGIVILVAGFVVAGAINGKSLIKAGECFSSNLSISNIESIAASADGGNVSGNPFNRSSPYRECMADFSPKSIAGLRLWLDGDATTTLALSGNDVTSWTGKSDFAHVASVLGNSPEYVATGLNGKGVLRFVSSSADKLSIPFTSNLNPDVMTLVLVLNPTSGFAGSFSGPMASRTETGDLKGYSIYKHSDTRWFALLGDTGIGGNWNTPFMNGVAFGTAEIVTTVVTSSNVKITTSSDEEVNSAAIGIFDENDNDLTPTPTMIGAINAANLLPFNGDIAEIIMYDNELSIDDMAKLNTYLKDKWGI